MNYKNQISDRVKILLIDEDESIFYLIRRVLQRENYRLYTSTSGRSGMEMSTSICPDLILMDGGRGQVNIALSVLEELGIDIPVCGMVKDDNHRTRGLYYHNIELPIDTHSEGFKLITRIQDEAHRFAIEYHRSLRSKTQVKSVLDDIPGVGPARRKALMRHFKSLEEIRQASVEELMEIPEMNERTAEEIVTFFASQTGQPVVH